MVAGVMELVVAMESQLPPNWVRAETAKETAPAVELTAIVCEAGGLVPVTCWKVRLDGVSMGAAEEMTLSETGMLMDALPLETVMEPL